MQVYNITMCCAVLALYCATLCFAAAAWYHQSMQGNESVIRTPCAVLLYAVLCSNAVLSCAELGLTLSQSSSLCRHLTPRLESKLGLRDTCGVHNLHGIPGILGGLVAALVSLTSYQENMGVMPAGHHQALNQIYGLLVTLGISVGGGFLAATAIKTVTPGMHQLQTDHMFDDSMWWDEETEAESSASLQEL